jgi:hypothetical protein
MECWSSGYCADWHPAWPECAPHDDEAADLALLWDGLRVGAPAAEIVGILKKWPNRVSYNASRQAIQVSGCRGTIVVAHIPLSPASAAVVSAVALRELE